MKLKKDIPVGGNSLGLPESGLRWKSELVWRAIFRATFLKVEDRIMKLRWRPRDEIRGHCGRGWGGVPSSSIELVLKQISLPVAQIRVICNNGPQDDIKYIGGKLLQHTIT
jgi:hypothetical protein